MRAPPGVAQEVWIVVCLSALNGMNVGRKKVLGYQLQGKGGEEDDVEYGARAAPRRPQVGGALVCSNSVRIVCASAAAVADFWARMASFAALTKKLKGVGVSTPFFATGRERDHENQHAAWLVQHVVLCGGEFVLSWYLLLFYNSAGLRVQNDESTPWITTHVQHLFGRGRNIQVWRLGRSMLPDHALSNAGFCFAVFSLLLAQL